MNGGDDAVDQTEILDAALDDLRVHVRVRDQGLAPGPDTREILVRSLPKLRAFGGNRYATMRAILDWDHQLPSQAVLLRIYAAYSGHEARLLDTQVRAREQQIEAGNIYPEFDLADYGDLDASESYVAVMRPGQWQIEDLRFFSPWRKEVRHGVAQAAIAAVRKLDSFKRAYRKRNNEALGGPVVVGWSPPCLADSENWAVEVWLLTEFDGQGGKAMVFMVDSETHQVGRTYLTDVHLQ